MRLSMEVLLISSYCSKPERVFNSERAGVKSWRIIRDYSQFKEMRRPFSSPCNPAWFWHNMYLVYIICTVNYSKSRLLTLVMYGSMAWAVLFSKALARSYACLLRFWKARWARNRSRIFVYFFFTLMLRAFKIVLYLEMFPYCHVNKYIQIIFWLYLFI